MKILSVRSLKFPLLFFLMVALRSISFAEDQKPSWKPQFFLYQPPEAEVSTSTVFRHTDPQIIQKLIDLLDETNLGKEESVVETPSIGVIKSFVTPEGFELKNRYTRLGVALSESLGWEGIKHIRVISEQNLQQRLTTVARWDNTPNVRSIALIALASLKDKNDFVYFQEALWSRNIGIRYATIEALLKWHFPEAVPILQNLLSKDESLLIRVAAASALARMSQPDGLTALRKNMDDKDWFVRALSAKALGEVGTDEDYDLLLNQLNREMTMNSNDFVAAEISIAALKLFPQKIEKEKEERELKKRKKNPALPPVQPAEKKAPQPRKDVLFELDPLIVTAPRLKITQEEPVDSRVNYRLLKILQEDMDLRISQEWADQSAAYKDLNQLVTPNGIRLKARYTVLGFLVAEGLAGTKEFQLVDQLEQMARGGKNPDVRSFALVALAYAKERNHMNLFQDALRKDNPADRFAGIEALEAWGYPEAIPILLGVVKLDNSSILKVYAAQAMFRLGDPIGKDFLIRSLDDPDWVARAMAMRYLGEMGSGEDYNRLLAYLGSEQPKIVQAEMCSSLLRLYAKKIEQEESENKK